MCKYPKKLQAMEVRYPFLVDEELTTPKLGNYKTRGYFGIR